MKKLPPPSALAPKAPSGVAQPMLGGLKLKQVFIADTGDGSFTDDSVKVKPNRNGPGMVFKCTDIQRLKSALWQAGLNPDTLKIVRGKKHFVCVLSDQQIAKALQGNAQKALGSGK